MWSFFSRDSSKDFNYEIGEVYGLHLKLEEKTCWNIHKGKKKGTNEEVTIFIFDNKSKNTELYLETAKAAIKRLKTLRHPSILTYIDSYETEKLLYLVTESVEILPNVLYNLNMEKAQKDLYISWGIFQITRALSFLNNDGNLKHNNVNIWSIFVNSSGEWKLGSVDLVSSVQEQKTPILSRPTLEYYRPPEFVNTALLRSSTKCSTDMWGLGCLIYEIFHFPLDTYIEKKSPEHIPQQLRNLYTELLSENPQSRPNPADIITRCRKLGGYFKNDLVDTLLFLEETQIKDKNEKNKFFSNLTPHLDNFPDILCKHRILPQLITAFEYGDAGSAVLAPMFKLGRLLDEAEYQKKIVPCVVKLFVSNDRATRSRLLQQLEYFISHLQASTVNDQIFPQIAHGFMDTNPTIREQTVKSVIHLAPKLNYNNLNVEVLRHFARLQAKDDQGGIRTNTTVCLGKIAQHLHPQIRQKVLISAFIRAMRDPFPPARNAGILALAATQQYYLLSEISQRILPALCHLALDPEKSVRDSVFRTIKGFLGKLEKVSEDPSLREVMEADVNTATPSLGNAAATWAGWAVTAVTAKFYRSQSDTVRSMNNFANRILHKPGSLEQPSSSSISTTTSSVTSMTSLEHEDGSKGNESVSDYDYDHWGDNENWGDMETGEQMASSSGSGAVTGTQSDPTSPPSGSGGGGGGGGVGNDGMKVTDGWDNEDWGSLDEEPEADGDLTSPSSAWSPTDSTPIIPLKTDNNKLIITNRKTQSGWDDMEFEPIDENSSIVNDKLEEARRKREEKKIMRQKELDARRASRIGPGGGPMKLGAKKI